MKKVLCIIAAVFLLSSLFVAPVMGAEVESEGETETLGTLELTNVVGEEDGNQYTVEAPATIKVTEDLPEDSLFAYAEIFEVDSIEDASVAEDEEPLEWDDAEYELQGELTSEKPSIQEYPEQFNQVSGSITLSEPGAYMISTTHWVEPGANFLVEVQGEEPEEADEEVDEDVDEDVEKEDTFEGYDVAQIEVDGESVEGDVPAVNLEGRTMVPLRFVSEAMGADVDWDEETETAIVSTEGEASSSAVGIEAGDHGTFEGHSVIQVEVDGEIVEGDVPAINLAERTMVPLRFVSEAMGEEVDWDDETNTAIVTTLEEEEADREEESEPTDESEESDDVV
ncbi:copper amine oxidase N-terminal domain-containing protein [Natranaerofaba carboxydovora]|uniref:copper amine oxidase N-terminal domain-containing protein n=1 Tax=Natranaerofaba carboxydovora TaxID=2742683 RepID=UPI001F143B7F|nr:copper amine oxidase N-terminal domain-containing protein [Natranaerofaba carboxydovora]UMZ74702.1 hypothetical protein ACONDI_02302 [Natranaerofaba carboxydovora]